MRRRDFILQSAATLLPLAAFPNINFNKYRYSPLAPVEYSRRAVDLVHRCVVIDMLNQFSMPGAELDGWFANPGSFESSVQKYRDSGIDAFALGHGAQNRAGALSYFTKWNRFIAGNPATMKRIDKASDFEYANQNGLTGVLLTFQDSRHFEKAEDVATFYDFGQRLSQLTYNYFNQIGSGAFDNDDKGLTEYGRSVVKKMNDVGMSVDLSHCSDKTTLEAIELSSKPPIITHANCRALNPGNPRTKTDEMIRNLAAKGGVFGIAEIRFMVRGSEPVTIEHFLDHYDHLIKLVGAEHAGIGTDFDLDTDDGRISLEERKKMFVDTTNERFKKYRMHSNDQYLIGVEGLNHPKRIFDIVEGFIRRGYSDDVIEMILGKNFMRAASQTWK
jgi:membrane dipeptidase